MATSSIKNRYTDLDLTFTRHPVKNDLVLSVDDKAVIRSVRNLILTNHYERPFHPEIGSNVRKMLFEPISPLTANYLQREIEDTIRNFEPRVRIQQVIVQTAPDSNAYSAIISFFINNNTAPTTINFVLQRLR
jgi:phage baseplate assembly protein W